MLLSQVLLRYVASRRYPSFGGEAHAVQLVEQGLVNLYAVQARQQAVRGGALLVQLDELLHGSFVGEGFGCGRGCFGHG